MSLSDFLTRTEQTRLTAASLPDLQAQPRLPAEYFPPSSLQLPEAGGSDEESLASLTLCKCVCVRRSGRRGRNVRGMGEEVSDTAASYHANYTVNVIIGNTNLAAGNYGGKTDNFWGFSPPLHFGVVSSGTLLLFVNAKQ